MDNKSTANKLNEEIRTDTSKIRRKWRLLQLISDNNIDQRDACLATLLLGKLFRDLRALDGMQRLDKLQTKEQGRQ